MRIPLTKYGLPQVIVFPAALIVTMIVVGLGTMAFLPAWVVILAEAIIAAMFVWTLMFFRDPERRCPSDINLLLASADGRITDIEQVDEQDFIQGPALRIGIFLSIFDVHINRSPCNAKVRKITHKEGRYINAMNPKSGRINESNNIGLVRTNKPEEKLFVRQISGAIARRIVCDTAEGRELAGGERFGMIKFGSRTELYVPILSYVSGDANPEDRVNERTKYASRDVRYGIKCLVKIGDKVRAGVTPLMKYVVIDAEKAENKF
jgi:phosphatidylserine decarboxylase